MARRTITIDEKIAILEQKIVGEEKKKAEKIEAYDKKIAEYKAQKEELLTQKQAVDLKKIGEYIAATGVSIEELVSMIQAKQEETPETEE